MLVSISATCGRVHQIRQRWRIQDRAGAMLASLSPKCVKEEFCELRLYGILGSSPRKFKYHSFGGGAWHQMIATVVAVYNTAGLSSLAL
jgi:hypothetical protein